AGDRRGRRRVRRRPQVGSHAARGAAAAAGRIGHEAVGRTSAGGAVDREEREERRDEGGGFLHGRRAWQRTSHRPVCLTFPIKRRNPYFRRVSRTPLELTKIVT